MSQSLENMINDDIEASPKKADKGALLYNFIVRLLGEPILM